MQTFNSTQTALKKQQSVRKKDPFLVIDSVTKVYPTPKGPAVVLDGIDLTVYEGEFICLIGHSGCGKSTLLNMVSGFLSGSKN